MTILKEKHTERDGNDCLIKSSVVLLEFSDTNYLVISTEQFLGGWTDDDIINSTWSFKNREEAYSKYNQITGEKTLIDCDLVLGCIDIGIGRPRQYDGKCEGYAKSDYDDEPCERCKNCELNTMYGIE